MHKVEASAEVLPVRFLNYLFTFDYTFLGNLLVLVDMVECRESTSR